jgi:hypothetical protein
MKAADAARLDMFAELGPIDDMGEMTYHEKHAFNLEHLAGVTCLTYLKYPNFSKLLSLSNPQRETLKNAERLGFFFASGDSFGCVKVWEVDRRASLMTFNYKEDHFKEFTAGPPPKVFDICQVSHFLVACLAHPGQPGIIQVWDMVTKKDVACVLDAHGLEITCAANCFGMRGSEVADEKECRS